MNDIIMDAILKGGLPGIVIAGAGYLVKYVIDRMGNMVDKQHEMTQTIMNQAKEDKEALYKLNIEKMNTLEHANNHQRREHEEMHKSIMVINEALRQLQTEVDKGRICRA